MTSDKDIDKDEEDEEGSEDDDEEEDEEEAEQEEEEDDDEQQDNMLSADPGEVQMNNAGETLNGDLENIFDADDADADAVGPGQDMGDNISADMHLSSTAAASIGGSINSSNNKNGKARPPADALAQGQTWQNEKSDREFRKTLIKDIAILLKERKTNPTDKWIRELPYKARKLEEQLYKTAPTLEAYLDKATLKHRLKKVAHAITSQFRLSKQKTHMSLIPSVSRHSGNAMPPSSDPSTTLSSLSSLPSRITNPLAGTHDYSPSLANAHDIEINQKLLQEQILENIRQQQLIMKSLMMTQNQSGGGMNTMMDPQSMINAQQQHLSMGGFSGQHLLQQQQQHQQQQQQMHGGQGNSLNTMNNIENMLLLQQAQQMGYSGAGLNMNSMGNSLSSQQLAMMNSMGLGSNMSSSAGLGSAGGIHGMMGMNSMSGMNAMNANPMYQNQANMLRNSFTGGSIDPTSAMLAMTQQAGMGGGSVIPAPSMLSSMNLGVHPTMPPPSFGVSGRSSFSGGTGLPNEENRSLSPNSFNW